MAKRTRHPVTQFNLYRMVTVQKLKEILDVIPDGYYVGVNPTSQDFLVVDPEAGPTHYDQLVGIIDIGDEAYKEIK